MAKKNLKRALALGALMAFVITGSAMAGNFEGGYIANDKLQIGGSHNKGAIAPADNTDINIEVLYSYTLNQGDAKTNTGVSTLFFNQPNNKFSYNKKVDILLSTDLKGTGNNSANGLLVYGGNVTFNDNVNITAKATDKDGKSVYAVSAYGDEDEDAIVSFNGANVTIKAETVVDRTGSYVSQDKNSRGEIMGVSSAYGKVLSSANTNVEINVASNGITVGEDYKDDGDVELGAAYAYGICAESGAVEFLGDTKVNVTSKAATATGVKVIDGFYTSTTGNMSGNAYVNLNNAVVNVSNSGVGGKSVGLEASNFIDNNPNVAEISLAGNLDLVVSGDTARGVQASDSKKILLGGEKSDHINIDVKSSNANNGEKVNVGVFALSGSQVDINTKNLVVNSTATGKGWAYGVSAQNNTTDATSGFAQVNIKADDITITSTSAAAGQSVGLVAMSQGVLNVNGNLVVTADSALTARGGAKVNVNTDGKHSTVLNGDIEFSYDGPTSGTPIDAKVNVNLSGANSVWNGNAKVGWNKLSQDKYDNKANLLKVEGFSVTLADGAKWVVTAPVKEEETSVPNNTYGTLYSGQRYLGINSLTMNNGGKVQNHAEGQAVEVDNLYGKGAIFELDGGGCIKVANFKNDDVTVDSGTLNLTGDTTITGKLSLKNGADVAVGKINEKAELMEGKHLILASTAKLAIDDLGNYTEYPAIEAGKVTAEKGASVSIGTAAEGTYTIVKADDVDNQMSDEDVTFDGGLKTGTWINSATEMNLKVAIKNLKEETELVPTENAGLVEAALKNINNLNKNNNTQQLADFFNKISKLAEEANSATGTVTAPQVKAAIASSVQSGTNNGAASTAASVVNNVSSITNNRLSIVAPAPKGGMGVGLFAEESGAGVWAQYLHGKDKAEDLPSGSSKTQYKNSYNGIVVGADFKKVDKFQSGIAFSYTDGDGSNSSTTGGTLGSTGHTDFKSYGVTYYGSIKNDDTNTMFDIGYNHSKADSDTNILLTGHTDSSTSKTNTWSAGVTVEKSYTDGNNGAQFIPYAGVRYMNINTDDFTTQMGYKNVMDDQNVFMIPVGIKFRQENVYKNGWKVTPKADLSYIWAMGDTDSNVNVTIPGLPSEPSVIGYTVMDDGSFLGTLGIEAAKGDWTYGLSYSYQKGEYQRSDKWFVDVRYSF